MIKKDLANPTHFKNKILQNLTPDILGVLELQAVELPANREMEFPGSTIDHLFFVEEGAASMTATFQDGAQVEVNLFGYESVIGVSALMGTRRSLNRVYMQIAGKGFSCSIEKARREFRGCGRFHDIVLRYVQAQLTQSAQSAACNLKHENEQRLARWLLLCADRANSHTFSLSQEFLATMLGMSRPSVTIIVGHLADEGVLTHKRGNICIADAAALEKKACECYRVVKRHLDNYLEFDTGFVAEWHAGRVR